MGVHDIMLKPAFYAGTAMLLSACVVEVAPPASQLPGDQSSQVSRVAVQACVDAVRRQGGTSRVVGREWSQANSLVTIRDDRGNGNWRCLVSNTGVVQDLTFSGGQAGAGGGNVFSAMERPCRRQAAAYTGLPRSSVNIIDRVRTGQGPVLTLRVGRGTYYCRRQPGGGVTVGPS